MTPFITSAIASLKGHPRMFITVILVIGLVAGYLMTGTVNQDLLELSSETIEQLPTAVPSEPVPAPTP